MAVQEQEGATDLDGAVAEQGITCPPVEPIEVQLYNGFARASFIVEGLSMRPTCGELANVSRMVASELGISPGTVLSDSEEVISVGRDNSTSGSRRLLRSGDRRLQGGGIRIFLMVLVENGPDGAREISQFFNLATIAIETVVRDLAQDQEVAVQLDPEDPVIIGTLETTETTISVFASPTPSNSPTPSIVPSSTTTTGVSPSSSTTTTATVSPVSRGRSES